MKLAIMQPYLFPYIGYFQLLDAVDEFVFYDDVNFIKRGWINRNKLLNQGAEQLFSVPLKGASQNRLIKDTEVALNTQWLDKFYLMLSHNYSRAPYYKPVLDLIRGVFEARQNTISALAIASISDTCSYLGLDLSFKLSSKDYAATQSFKGADRLRAICRESGADIYINAIGGVSLYEQADFEREGVALKFIKSDALPYGQFKNEFVPWLSIIDVLMFNAPKDAKVLLKAYKLV